jgi:hypothetical protein
MAEIGRRCGQIRGKRRLKTGGLALLLLLYLVIFAKPL